MSAAACGAATELVAGFWSKCWFRIRIWLASVLWNTCWAHGFSVPSAAVGWRRDGGGLPWCLFPFKCSSHGLAAFKAVALCTFERPHAIYQAYGLAMHGRMKPVEAVGEWCIQAQQERCKPKQGTIWVAADGCGCLRWGQNQQARPMQEHGGFQAQCVVLEKLLGSVVRCRQGALGGSTFSFSLSSLSI